MLTASCSDTHGEALERISWYLANMGHKPLSRIHKWLPQPGQGQKGGSKGTSTTAGHAVSVSFRVSGPEITKALPKRAVEVGTIGTHVWA
jgi:hypothetical protein